MRTSIIDGVIQTKEEKTERKGTRVIHSYRVSKNTSSLIFSIPKDIQERYNLGKPTSLYLIPKKDCIVLKKVDLEGIDE